MSAVPPHRQPQKAEPATSVVIVGSGFAAFECARRLARRLDRARASDVRVTIVSPVDYMQYSPLLADVAGGLVDPRFVCIPLAGTLKGVQAVRGRVDSVDFDRHMLSFTDPEGRVGTLSWDRLVLTPGSVTRLFDTPGLATHARGLKSTAEALYLRDRVLEQLELAHVDENEARAAARRTIVVVGASYSGSELTAQLRALADAAAKQMGFDRASVRFVLLDLADHVMPEVGQKLGDAAMRVLRSRGIDVRLGTTLKEVHADHVVLTRRFAHRYLHGSVGGWRDPVTADRRAGLGNRAGPAEGAGRFAGTRSPRRVCRGRRRRRSGPNPAGQERPAHRPARDPTR